MPNPFSYNILVTLDRNYLPVLRVMLHSLSQSDPEGEFTVYAVHNSLTEQDLQRLHALFPRVHPVSVKVPEGMLAGAPVSDRYPTEMYYRLFAAHYLPQQLDRILYLDPDLVVLNSLRKLYEIDFGDNLFAAASHIESRAFRDLNRLRLNLPEQTSYINSGVMMMNLKLLRNESTQEIIDYINEHKNALLLPDQDVLNALYAGRIIELDPMIYNLGDKYLYFKNVKLPREERFDLEWVRRNTVVVHYYGRNKPWKENYLGVLGVFYQHFSRQLTEMEQKLPPEPVPMRREERRVSDTGKIRDILSACDCCRLGLSDDGRVYIVPLSFGFTEQDGRFTFYFHSAKEGRKIRLLTQNGCAAFELDCSYQLKEGPTACSHSALYQSVTGFGRVTFLTQHEEKKQALLAIMRQNTGREDWEIPEAALDNLCTFRLDADEISCKEHR